MCFCVTYRQHNDTYFNACYPQSCGTQWIIYCANTLSKIPCRLFQILAETEFFTLLVWLTLSWKITEQGLALNPMGIQLALLITLRFNLILSLTRLLLIDMNESLLLQALRRLPLPENYFISLFSLFAIFPCSVKYIKRWIWQCEHVATSQN